MSDTVDGDAVSSQQPTAEAIASAVASGNAVVCYTKCWPCNFGSHFDPPQWHTWADEEDVQHAAATSQPDPSISRCGCHCATEEAA